MARNLKIERYADDICEDCGEFKDQCICHCSECGELDGTYTDDNNCTCNPQPEELDALALAKAAREDAACD